MSPDSPMEFVSATLKKVSDGENFVDEDPVNIKFLHGPQIDHSFLGFTSDGSITTSRVSSIHQIQGGIKFVTASRSIYQILFQ